MLRRTARSILAFAVPLTLLGACAEPECPVGTFKVRNICRREDAGTSLDDAAVVASDAASEHNDGQAAEDGGTQRDASTVNTGTGGSDAAGAVAVIDSAVAIDAGGSEAGGQNQVQTDSGSSDASTAPLDAGVDAVVSCSAGYVLKNGACQDIDECFEGTHQCHMTSLCANAAGSYDCTCPLGYSGGTSAGFACAPRIAVGSEHACVLLGDRTVQCWGKNTYGQLGDGTQTERSVPVTVVGLRDVAAVNCAGGFTCALLQDGTVRCWGDNTFGMLGDGTMMNRSAPVTVTGLVDIVAIDAYGNHACAVVKSGAVRCWGADSKGQLGRGSASTTPSPSAVGVSTISSATNVFVGAEQTCIVLRGGQTQCWGEGFLGMGAMSSSLLPVTIQIPAGVRSIGFGYRHACAVRLDNSVYCWGATVAGGNGNTGGDGSPAIVSGTSAIAASLGFYSTFIIRPDRTLAWWDLGTLPTNATGFPRVVAFDSLLAQGRAIAEDGRVISWMVSNPSSSPMLAPPTTVAGLDLW